VVVVEALVQQDGGDTRILVGEAVVILTPHVGGHKQVHGGDRLTPRDLADSSLQPLGVLVQHGVDHVDEGLVGAPDAVTTGQQVALEEAFHLVLGQLLGDLAGDSHVLIDLLGQVAGVPLLVGHFVSGLQTVGSGLVRSEDTEVVRVVLDDVAGVDAQAAGSFQLAPAVAVLLDFLDLVVLELRELEVLADHTTVGVRVGADAQLAFRHEGGDVSLHSTVLVEQLFRLVGLEPVLEDLEVSLGIAGGSQRHLVGTPGTLGLLAVDELRAGPALRGAEDDHRVERTMHIVGLSGGLDLADLVEDGLEELGETTVDGHVVLIVEASDELVRLVTHAVEELVQLFVGDAGQDGRVGDLVAVEVQDRQHDTVGARVDELVGLPAGSQRAGLSFAVADDGRDEEGRVVHHSAVSVGQSVTQLATLVDGARGLRSVVGRDAARVGELAEELLQASFILGDLRESLGVGAVQVGLSGTGRAAVARAHDDHGVLLVISDEAVDVADEEVQARGGAPVAHETMLDIFAGERSLHQRVAAKVDLADGQVVSGTPVLVNAFKGFLRNGSVELLPRGANNRIRHVYSCNSCTSCAIDYYIRSRGFRRPLNPWTLASNRFLWYEQRLTFWTVFFVCVRKSKLNDAFCNVLLCDL